MLLVVMVVMIVLIVLIVPIVSHNVITSCVGVNCEGKGADLIVRIGNVLMSPMTIHCSVSNTGSDIVMSDMGVNKGVVVGVTTDQDSRSDGFVFKDFLHDSVPNNTNLAHHVLYGNRGGQDSLVIHDKERSELLRRELWVNIIHVHSRLSLLSLLGTCEKQVFIMGSHGVLGQNI